MAEAKDSAGSGDDAAMRIDPSLVRELAELLTANELTEIEVADGARQIRVQRLPGYNFVASDAPSAPAAPAAAAAPATPAAPAAEEIAGETVKSPMVGTAFLSPEPGAKPFVEVGEAVKAGSVRTVSKNAQRTAVFMDVSCRRTWPYECAELWPGCGGRSTVSVGHGWLD